MKTVALYSEKGGVGKTTVALHTAVAAADTGRRVLLVDADPSGGLAASLGLDSRNYRGIWGALAEEDWTLPPSEFLSTTVSGLVLLPTGAFPPAEALALESRREPTGAVRSLLERLGKEFDLVLLDTAPGLRGMTQGVLRAVEHVVVLVQAEPLALRGLPRSLEALKEIETSGEARLLGILLTMTDFHFRTSLDVVQEVWAQLPSGLVFESYIPRDRRIVEAQAAAVPISHYLSGRSPAGRAFQSFAEELLSRLGLAGASEEIRVRPFLS